MKKNIKIKEERRGKEIMRKEVRGKGGEGSHL